jgi:hypothetical protein
MKREDGYTLDPDYQPEVVTFRFTSIGKERSIEKIIEFTYIPNRPWNLGFGDVQGDDWQDNVVSNNNDFRKVLQTVANAIHQFCDMYPNSEIAIFPLENRRKLLYNRVFQQKWHEIEPLFTVKAVDMDKENPQFESYYPRKMFDFFVIKRKT